MNTIVVLEGYTVNPGDLDWKSFLNLGQLTVYDRTEPELIVDRAKDANILLSNKCLITRDVIDALPDLQYIGLLSTGYNVVDTQAARERGIAVTNIPAYSTRAVAQMVFAHILQFTNRVNLHCDLVRDGFWSSCPDFCFWSGPLTELAGKRLGIIGMGAIGRQTAGIGAAFGMKIVAYSPRPKTLDVPFPFEWVSLDTLLSASDFVSLHCPLSNETAGIISAENIARMKRTAILINTARGPVVDDAALASALNEGLIAGAGLDVLTSEPPGRDNPLLTAKNCHITPHIAWAAVETRARLMNVALANIEGFLSGNRINRIV